jgi:hypothetical protein
MSNGGEYLNTGIKYDVCTELFTTIKNRKWTLFMFFSERFICLMSYLSNFLKKKCIKGTRNGESCPSTCINIETSRSMGKDGKRMIRGIKSRGKTIKRERNGKRNKNK